MRLSPETITILKNFAVIQKGVFIRPGHILKSRNLAVYAEAEAAERFPVEAPLPDLGSLLKSLKFLRQPDFQFGKDKLTVVESAENAPKARLDFEYQPGMVTLPMDRKNFDEPEGFIDFTLSGDDLAMLKKAVTDLGKSHVRIASDGNTISVGTDMEKAGFSFLAEGDTHDCACEHLIDVKNLKIVPGDYTVRTTELYSEFRHRTLPILYLVAPEPVSTFQIPVSVNSRKRSAKPLSSGPHKK